MRAAAYLRVSTCKQEVEGTSLDGQAQVCCGRATNDGHAVSQDDVFREVFTGVEYDARPELARLRQRKGAGTPSSLQTFRANRLSFSV